MNSDSQKLRSFVAPLLVAGYGRRSQRDNMNGSLIASIWNPTTLILMGGIISLIGTFWATRQQVATERQFRIRAEETLSYLQGDHSLEIAHHFEGENQDILTLFVRNTSNLPTYSLTGATGLPLPT